MSSKRCFTQEELRELEVERAKILHKEQRNSSVKLPSYFNQNDMQTYKWNGCTHDMQFEGEYNFTSLRRNGFKFDHNVYFPSNRVFIGRETHCVIKVRYEDGGLFSADKLWASIKLLAYPDNKEAVNGFGHVIKFEQVGRALSADNVFSFLDKLFNTLKAFIENPDEHGNDDEIQEDKYRFRYMFFSGLSYQKVHQAHEKDVFYRGVAVTDICVKHII